MSKKAECDEKENSITVKVPPLGVSVFSFSQKIEKVTDNQGAKKAQRKRKSASSKGKKGLKEEIAKKMQEE